MAGTVLSDLELARIDRGLDELVMPAFETVRALVAETRLLRAENVRYAGALAKVAQTVEHAAAGRGPHL